MPLTDILVIDMKRGRLCFHSNFAGFFAYNTYALKLIIFIISSDSDYSKYSKNYHYHKTTCTYYNKEL